MNTIRLLIIMLLVGGNLVVTGCTNLKYSLVSHDFSGKPGPGGSRVFVSKTKVARLGPDGEMVRKEFGSTVTNHPCQHDYADTIFPNFVGGMDAAVDANVYSGLHPLNHGNNHNHNHRHKR